MSARQRPPRQRPESSSPLGRLQSHPEPVRVGEQVRESTSEVPESETSELANSQTAEDAKSDTSEAPQSGSTDVPNQAPESESSAVPQSGTPEVSEYGSSGVPKYRTLERKDVRVRADQLDALTRLTRRVSAARTDRSERITENTVVRVAIDMLLDSADRLEGNTEDELRESVTSEVR